MCNFFTSLIFFILALTLFPYTLEAQKLNDKKFSKELTITNDNDFYLPNDKDGYYTNGLMIKFNSIAHSRSVNIIKKINQYEIGQLLFTQGKRKIYDASQIDRPITGYLYGKFLQSRFLQENKFWQWGVSIGTIGKAALGRNMQSFYHRQINVNSAFWEWIWNYELNNEVGVNMHGSFGKALLKDEDGPLQITPAIDATLGTTFTNVSPGVLFQLGKMNKTSESSYWHSKIDNNVITGNEIYFFYHPQLTWQAYNATVQGGMFRNDKGPITSSIEPFVLLQQFGIMYATRRVTGSLQVHLQTREATMQQNNHAYARVQIGYRF